MTNETEKLDNLSKILLATSAINYMATQIDKTYAQFERMAVAQPDDPMLGHLARVWPEALELTAKELTGLMERLGNFMNNNDASMPIDQRILDPAFKILIHGEDDVEGDNDSVSVNP